MISTILQYGNEMADINANNIFHKKLLSRHVNQVGQKVAEMVLWWSSFRIWSNGSGHQTNKAAVTNNNSQKKSHK
jgi:hypothetical protein